MQTCFHSIVDVSGLIFVMILFDVTAPAVVRLAADWHSLLAWRILFYYNSTVWRHWRHWLRRGYGGWRFGAYSGVLRYSAGGAAAWWRGVAGYSA